MENTHEVIIHPRLYLIRPLPQVLDLVLELVPILAVLQGSEDAEHACGSPSVACRPEAIVVEVAKEKEKGDERLFLALAAATSTAI